MNWERSRNNAYSSEGALLRAIGDASQAADKLRDLANLPQWGDAFHDAMASFVLLSAAARNRYHEYEEDMD